MHHRLLELDSPIQTFLSDVPQSGYNAAFQFRRLFGPESTNQACD